MSETRVKIQTVVQNQLPGFVVEESPLLVEFLKQYYVSQEYTSGTYDIIQNIDKYVKLDEILNHASTATLLSDIDSITDTITDTITRTTTTASTIAATTATSAASAATTTATTTIATTTAATTATTTASTTPTTTASTTVTIS